MSFGDAPVWLRLALAILATWRITHLLASEDGPAGVILQLRRWLGATLAGRLMDCFACLSFWVAAVMACFVSLQPADWLLTTLALSGAALLLERGHEPQLAIAPAEAISQSNGEST